MTDGESVVPVFVARNLSEADIVRGLLQANGIDAIIENEEGVAVLDGIVSGNRGVVLSVRAEDLGAAQEVIRAAHHAVAFEEEE